MKGEIRNLPASVMGRLRNRAREAQKPFDEILRYYGFERFLPQEALAIRVSRRIRVEGGLADGCMARRVDEVDGRYGLPGIRRHKQR